MALSFSSIGRNRYAEPAAAFACVVFAIIVVWLLVRLVWALVPRSDAALEIAPPRLANDSRGAVPAQSVANWHLFGNARALASGGPAAPATALSLILRGTFAASNPRAGIAVIADQAGEERAFSVGDDVLPGARLTAVYPDRIVLSHDGTEESLQLLRDHNLTPGNIVRPTPATVTSQSGGAASRNVFAPSSASGLGAATAGASADLKRTLAEARANPAELMKRVQIVPVLNGGKLGGVRLSASGDPGLIEQLGLRAGDIVTAVDGTPIDSFARGEEIMAKLKNANSVNVTVLRDGQSVAVRVGLQ